MIQVAKQIGFYFLILFTITFLLFFLFHGIGDPSIALTDQRIDPKILNSIRHQLGWDRPLLQRFFIFLQEVTPITFSSSFPYLAFKIPNLGISFHYQQPVFQIYIQHFQFTLLLVIPSLVFATLLAILFGTLVATSSSETLKKVAHIVSMIGISLPSYFSAILLIAFTLTLIPSFPVIGSPIQIEVSGTHFAPIYLILPILSLAIRPFALLFQLHFTSTEETLKMPFIRTAEAYGFPRHTILFKYTLRPAFIPTFTAFSNWLASLLSGTFFIEVIFNYPGVGTLLVNAIQTYDYPLVMGCCLITAWVFLLIVFLTDLIYPLIDPRIIVNR